MPTLFFSWQSDTDEKVGRYFLREALRLALLDLASDASLEEAQRTLELDHDTKGVPGSPPIVETIYRKIRAAALFVSDMTYVGTRLNGKRTPNPNVLIEHGVAIEALGHERVISVMNTAFGSTEEFELPFDLRHVRWPLLYRLAIDADKVTIQKVQREFAKRLAGALRATLGALPAPAIPAKPAFARAPQAPGQASFRDNPLATLGRNWSPVPFLGGAGDKKVLLANGPSIWVRLIPGGESDKVWSPEDLHRWATYGGVHLMPLVALPDNSSPAYLVAADGFGLWMPGNQSASKPEDPVVEACSVAFAFETGEVWAVDRFILGVAGKVFSIQYIVDRIVYGMNGYAAFLRNLGFKEPFVWKAGIAGAQDFSVMAPVRPNTMFATARSQHRCNSDDILAEGTLEAAQPVREAISPFIEVTCRRCGFSRPDYL